MMSVIKVTTKITFFCVGILIGLNINCKIGMINFDEDKNEAKRTEKLMLTIENESWAKVED